MKALQTVIEIVDAGSANPPALTRRQLMTWLAASAALASAGCSRPPEGETHPFVQMPEMGLGGEALYYASSFVRNGFAHGVLIGTREGRPIKIEGNPLHPASLGGTDVFAQASILQLWDPERAQTVLQRNEAGAAALPSTWSAFDAAWQQRAALLRERRGAGLRVLTGTVTSPTLQAQLAALAREFPAAVVHRHDPLAPVQQSNGTQLAFGRALRLVHDAARARLVVALGGDPFTQPQDGVRLSADWARARSADGDGKGARLIAIETTPGLFGARADERRALPPSAIEAMLERIAARCGVAGLAPAPAEPDAFETRLTAAIQVAGPDTLLIGGEALSARAHAVICLLHQQLGAWNRTVRAIAPPEGEAHALSELVEAIGRGEVDTLLVLEANPAYDAPGELDMARAMAQVPFTVRAGLYDDETSLCCHWHLPLSHGFEQWSDARAFDGTASLIQPAIAPLFDTRSAIELFAALLNDPERNGRMLVRRQWRTAAGDDRAFEDFWRRSLRSGCIEGTSTAFLEVEAATLPPAEALSPSPSAPSDLVAVFPPDPCVGDGAFANNGWLQELPRPFTQITWANAVQIGPMTAARLGVTSGDVVSVRTSEHGVDAPVWVQQAHAEDAVTLPLGLGRRHGGKVAAGIGFDAYPLRPHKAPTATVSLRKTGRRTEFARTQQVLEQHGRELARSVPATRPELPAEPTHPSLYPPLAAPDGPAWGMAIDLDACIGCNACTVACQAENNIPVVGADQVARGRVMHWIRIDHYEEEAPGATASGVFQPVPCMHCENAPCEIVCPVGATVHDSEGLNVQVYNRCVGTRFCSNNCPYKVRRFNFLQYSDAQTETYKAQRNPDVTVRARGVMEKCTYCVQRVTRARLLSEKNGQPLADGDVVTACQSACPTGAIHFGDIRDPASAVSRAKASPRNYTLLGELNTRPRTTYLARVRPDEGTA